MEENMIHSSPILYDSNIKYEKIRKQTQFKIQFKIHSQKYSIHVFEILVLTQITQIKLKTDTFSYADKISSIYCCIFLISFYGIHFSIFKVDIEILSYFQLIG